MRPASRLRADTTWRRSISLALLSTVLVAVFAGCNPANPPATAPTSSFPVPSHVWPLDGSGRPAAGDVELAFSGSYDLGGEAVALDGGSGFAATSGPGPVDTTESFSVAAWVNLSPPRRLGGDQFPAAVSQTGEVAAAFYLGVGEGRWSFTMKDMDTNEHGHTFRASSATASPDPDTWRHLVGIYDKQAKQIRLYLDGKPAAQQDFTASWQAGGPLTVGRSQTNARMSDFWPGAVADVRIFPAVLGDGDISALANQGKPASPPPAMPIPPFTTGIPNGTYEYTFSDQEKAKLKSTGTAAETAKAGGLDGTVATAMRIQDGQWQQYFISNGKIYGVNGQPEGDGGTYTIKGDRLITSNGEVTVTYRWSLSNDVLTLTVVDDSAGAEDAEIVRLITEHKYNLAKR